MRPEVRIPRDDMLAALLAASPPRRVPPPLEQAALRQAGPRSSMFFGVAFGLFGMVFVVVFFPWNFLRDWRLRGDGAATTNGKIISAGATSMSINDTPVWQYRHEFRLQGEPVRGDCYTTGPRWSAGQSVTVRYLSDDPVISCVDGARSSKSGGFGMFVLIFPAIGFGLVAWSFVRRRRAMALLQNGKLGEAIIASVEQTGARINYQPVYKIALRLRDRAAAVPLTIRCHTPDVVTFAETRFKNGQPVYVLYDPMRPKRLLLPETL